MADEERPGIRVEPATDAARFVASDRLIWFNNRDTDPLEAQVRSVPEDQRFFAEVVGSEVDPATYPGIYATRDLDLSVPDGEGRGRAVPVSGLTWVGVHPDHRRRGLLTAMMEHHVGLVRQRGLHFSALHASEPGIYGRHGYGLASHELEVKVGRGVTLNAPHLEDEAATITTRLETVDDPGMGERRRQIDAALLASNVGTILGRPEFYDDLSHVTAEETRESEPPRVIIAVQDGHEIGYVVFKRTHSWPNSRPAAEVNVWSISGGPAARLALLRRVTDLDLSGSITIKGIAASDPLLSWVQGPRGLGDVRPFDSLWLRLVDLPEAVAARGYEADCDVVVEVADRLAPWNAGRWRIRVKDGTGEATRSDDDAQLELTVAVLGAAYLGGQSLSELRRAGVISERRPGAVSELGRAFRTDIGPYAARGF
jgi:predicted acetyltransferase